MIGLNDEDLSLMLKIRRFELTLLDLFSQGKIKGTTHTCLGQEYIPVAVRPFVEKEDFVMSNHRGHGHFIAFTDNVEGILREITGKKGAVCNSMGGSQHLFNKNVMTTGIQGEGASVALGIAWTMKHSGKKNVTYVFVGDGTFGRGAVYESLNMACLYNLPYVMVVENNGIAMSTLQSQNMSGTIEDRVRAFGADYIKVTEQNPSVIRPLIDKGISNVRSGAKPLVIEFVTNRVGAHSKSDDTREAEELNRIKEQYWYNICKKEYGNQMEILEKVVEQEMELILNKVMTEEIISDYGT